mmetsp:Transcript_15115/g.38358  ORF Transcript_15115/g.38358 Transcript_15115/m.38358 type:complete len:205 (+) Transcript_15115:657-1271(+)
MSGTASAPARSSGADESVSTRPGASTLKDATGTPRRGLGLSSTAAVLCSCCCGGCCWAIAPPAPTSATELRSTDEVSTLGRASRCGGSGSVSCERSVGCSLSFELSISPRKKPPEARRSARSGTPTTTPPPSRAGCCCSAASAAGDSPAGVAGRRVRASARFSSDPRRINCSPFAQRIMPRSRCVPNPATVASPAGASSSAQPS